jgi:hypothetical protein
MKLHYGYIHCYFTLLHDATSPHITFHYLTLPYITLHYLTLACITLH